MSGTEILESNSTELLDYRGDSGALESITKAEIDTQIATAKRYPRSPAKFLSEAYSMVSISPDLAEKCTYSLKRKDENGREKLITGPSVRLAEIVAICWGNLRIVGRVIGDDGKAVTAQGVCLDLEKNVGYSGESRRGVTKRNGQRFSNDMVNVTCNAAIAIATRNATFKAVPRAFVNCVLEHAQQIARGDVKTLPERAGKALAYFARKGVTDREVFGALGVNGLADMSLDHLQTLQGFRTSVEEGHATIGDIFRPTPEPEQPRRNPGETATDALVRRMEQATPAPASSDGDEPPDTFTEPDDGV